MCGRAQGKRVHINACKPFLETCVHRVAVWALEDELLEHQARLSGAELTEARKLELEVVLEKWGTVLTDKPGSTDILEHDIDTGDAPPVRSAQYHLPAKWKEAVGAELDKLRDWGILVPSVSRESLGLTHCPCSQEGWLGESLC